MCTEPVRVDIESADNEPLISAAICSEPLINPPGKLADGIAGLDAPIVIVPTTSRLPDVALNLRWLPDALPSKKLPAPSTKNPCPLVALVGNVEPIAITGVVAVESILILLVPVVKILNLALCNSIPSPELLRN